ncbi:MAG: T9SS type A sorting domain-containing protein, partial [Bacteroidota bacterium]
IAFEVITETAISNVLNYPNPFTTSTRFVFTLTGSELPDDMMIQIMTVSGKVVREIYMEELGPIKIGNNLTDFAWDGTDMYGDRLANGVYLYRVITQFDGQEVLEFKTNTNQYFKNGYGKMYLMR